MEYLIHIGILISIYSLLGISLNLILGYTGLLSMTSAAFYGIGGYMTAILISAFGINFFLAMLISAFISGTIALIIGYTFSKFRGDYFALGSFGFNIITVSIFVNWISVTGGALGISGIDRPELFGFTFSNNLNFLLLSFFILILVYFVCRNIIKSSFGRILKAIREDEKAIEIFGYKTHYYKLAIFVIGGFIASLAGSLFASYITYINPISFGVNESIFILAIIILGGLSSNRGAIVGSIILIILPEALRFIGLPTEVAAQLRQIIYGFVLILLMLYRPQGLIGKYKI